MSFTQTNFLTHCIFKGNNLPQHQEQFIDSVKKSPQYSYFPGTFDDYKDHHSYEGWERRKMEFLGRAVYSLFAKTFYHLASACTISPIKYFIYGTNECQANFYSAGRDIEEALAHILVFFDDRWGTFYLNRALFHKECYAIFGIANHTPPPPPSDIDPATVEVIDFNTTNSAAIKNIFPHTESSTIKIKFVKPSQFAILLPKLTSMQVEHLHPFFSDDQLKAVDLKKIPDAHFDYLFPPIQKLSYIPTTKLSEMKQSKIDKNKQTTHHRLSLYSAPQIQAIKSKLDRTVVDYYEIEIVKTKKEKPIRPKREELSKIPDEKLNKTDYLPLKEKLNEIFSLAPAYREETNRQIALLSPEKVGEIFPLLPEFNIRYLKLSDVQLQGINIESLNSAAHLAFIFPSQYVSITPSSIKSLPRTRVDSTKETGDQLLEEQKRIFASIREGATEGNDLLNHRFSLYEIANIGKIIHLLDQETKEKFDVFRGVPPKPTVNKPSIPAADKKGGNSFSLMSPSTWF